jgi:hypothetical protein
MLTRTCAVNGQSMRIEKENIHSIKTRPWGRTNLLAQSRGHLVGERPGHNHTIRLPRTGTEDDPKPVQIVARSAGMHHLHRAARQPERHGPDGPRPRPVHERIHLGEDEFRPGAALRRRARRRRVQRRRRHHCGRARMHHPPYRGRSLRCSRQERHRQTPQKKEKTRSGTKFREETMCLQRCPQRNRQRQSSGNDR